MGYAHKDDIMNIYQTEEARKMFFFKRSVRIEYDPTREEPAVRRSICTGEMTAGFVDRRSGKFRELMRVKDQKELDDFCRSVGTKDIKTIY